VTERPDDDTLRLLREVLEEIATSEALGKEPLFQTTMTFEGDVVRTSYVEPPIRILRHLLDLLRHLDMPSSDVRLDRLFPIIDRLPLSDEWRAALETAKQEYRSAQGVRNIRIQQPDEGHVADPDTQATWIKPREAFDLWAYGGIIHHDYAKERKWTRLGIGQAAVREMAHEYTMMLLAEAAFLFRLLKSSESDAAALPGGAEDT
jgi:hypothetical protein